MAFIKNTNLKVKGIVCAIPDQKIDIVEYMRTRADADDVAEKCKAVGTKELYYTKKNQSSGDLGIACGRKLLERLEWDPLSVDGLVFVSQTPDYKIPPTVCRIQSELGLSEEVMAFDLDYGCMGFVSGLMTASQLIQSGLCKRVVLINAECQHFNLREDDAEGRAIFGDGASAVAIEKTDSADDVIWFQQHMDGSHCEDIIVEGYKALAYETEGQNASGSMDGENVTIYMLKQLPRFTRKMLSRAELTADDIDTFLVHQANAYMIRYFTKRMKISLDDTPVNIDKFGNTSGPSIPILICDKKQELFTAGNKERVLLLGYGSGFIISGAILDLGDLVGGDILYI